MLYIGKISRNPLPSNDMPIWRMVLIRVYKIAQFREQSMALGDIDKPLGPLGICDTIHLISLVALKIGLCFPIFTGMSAQKY